MSATPFSGYRFPPEVIALAVRWYLRFRLSYADVAELLAERGVAVDPSTIYDGNALASKSNRLIGRSCVNCHAQIHGSNSPAGNTLLR